MVNNDDFAAQLTRSVARYNAETKTAIKKAMRKRARQMKEEIISQSPVRADTYYKRTGITKPYLRKGLYPPGTFKSGWRMATLRDDGSRFLIAVVQDSSQKYLVHLLDQGHRIVTRNAAREERGKVPGKKWVSNAQKKYTQIVRDDINKILNK